MSFGTNSRETAIRFFCKNQRNGASFSVVWVFLFDLFLLALEFSVDVSEKEVDVSVLGRGRVRMGRTNEVFVMEKPCCSFFVF